MAITSLNLQMEDALVEEASAVYKALGLDLTSAIKMFLKRSILANGVPFHMTLPGKEYKAERAVRAMQELSDASARNGVRSMTLEEINAEIAAARRERELGVNA